MSFGSEKSSGSLSESTGSGYSGDSTDSGGDFSEFSVSVGDVPAEYGDSDFSAYWGFTSTGRISEQPAQADVFFGVVEFGRSETWYGGFRQTA